MTDIVKAIRPNITEARHRGVNIRPAEPGDLPFIDALQKAHSKQVGFLQRKAIETYIAKGNVLIAEEINNQKSEVSEEGLTSVSRSLGYVIGRDTYQKREDVGVIYQLNVAPGSRRKLIGAMLVKGMFERAAYGCRLFCCWCAQDIDANYFWESIGFTPLAFRAGSEKRSRIHIFWQKRIREGDDGTTPGGTPWWFPSRTGSGMVREDRVVIPIPPGTHWRDAKPMVLPGIPQVVDVEPAREEPQTGEFVKDEFDLRAEEAERTVVSIRQRYHIPMTAERTERIRRERAEEEAGLELWKPSVRKALEAKRHAERAKYGLKRPVDLSPGQPWIPPVADAATIERLEQAERVLREHAEREKASKPRRRKNKKPKSRKRQPKKVYDPRYLEAARELRDRFLEEVNAGSLLLAASEGKYDLSRTITSGAASPDAGAGDEARHVRYLDAA